MTSDQLRYSALGYCCERRNACNYSADTKHYQNARLQKQRLLVSHLDQAGFLLSSCLVLDAEVKEL